MSAGAPESEWSADLERQYNMRDAFPDYVKYFEDWRRNSGLTRRDLQCSLNVPYGAGQRETLDIFHGDPRVGTVLIFIHGGYWRTMDKADFSFLARPFVARGMTLVVPNYPFCPAVTIPEIVGAMRKMLSWVFENIRRYGGSEELIHLSGWSAGAHLATMLLTPVAGSPRPARRVHSALVISGIYDLRPIRRVSANADLRITEIIASEQSSVLVRPGYKMRVALVVGDRETQGIHSQAQALAYAWQEYVPNLSITSIANAHHYSVVSQLGAEKSELFGLAMKLLSGMR